MCFTLSTSTAYWITDRQLRSVCSTTLATLRCTNRSPGSSPTISLAGTRASEQPIHRYSGTCCLASLAKKSGSSSLMASAQRALLSNKCCRSLISSHPNQAVLHHTEATGAWQEAPNIGSHLKQRQRAVTGARCLRRSAPTQQQPGQQPEDQQCAKRHDQAGAPLQRPRQAKQLRRVQAGQALHAHFRRVARGGDIGQAIAVQVRQAADMVEQRLPLLELLHAFGLRILIDDRILDARQRAPVRILGHHLE